MNNTSSSEGLPFFSIFIDKIQLFHCCVPWWSTTVSDIKVLFAENPELMEVLSLKPTVEKIALHALFTARDDAFLVCVFLVHSSSFFLNHFQTYIDVHSDSE